MLNVDTMTNELTCAVATHNYAIFGMAHLYNALRQLRLTKLRWPALERIIELHPGPLFANDIPTTIEAMAKRMAYCFGTGVSLKAFNEKRPYVLPMAAASRIMKPFFLENAPLGRSVHLLDNQVQERNRLRLVGAPASTSSALADQT